jgi:hypothetical protein
MASPNRFATELDGMCFYGAVNGWTRQWAFQLVPTFFHEGGVFKLQYLDQCYRYTPDIAYANQAGSIKLKADFDDITYYATYAGGTILNWESSDGKTMRWEKTSC